MIRPSELASDRIDTNPTAAAVMVSAGELSRKKSMKIGFARSRMPIPAVTLKHRTTQSSQNWGVLIALRADTCPRLINFPCLACEGSQPAGFQSSAGTRMRIQPIAMKTA